MRVYDFAKYKSPNFKLENVAGDDVLTVHTESYSIHLCLSLEQLHSLATQLDQYLLDKSIK
jgi:hypothetical protein